MAIIPCERHCMHQTGQMLLSDPPQIEMICCRCGERSSIRCGTREEIDPSNHGPFMPRSFVSSVAC